MSVRAKGAPITGGSVKKPLLIVLAILAVVLLCFCGAVLGLVAVGIIAEPETVIEELAQAVVGDSAPLSGGDSVIRSRDFGDEVQRATEHFYPGYVMDSYVYLEGSDDARARLHVIAVSPDDAGFRILFATGRSGGDRTGYVAGEAEFLDPASGALWVNDARSSGLGEWAGPESIAPQADIVGPFVASHPAGDLLVTGCVLIDNVQVRLSGIRESAWDGWDGVSTSWESVWDKDVANSTWVEDSFAE